MFAPILLWYMYLLATNIPITKSVSVCEEIDIVCLIDVNAIKHSAGDVIEFIDNLVLKGSAEQSSVTVAVYGEVPKAGENIIQEEIFLINAEETIGITKGRKTKQEYIRNKLLSLTETMFSKSKIENLDLANIINNIAPSSKPKEFIVIQYDNDIFTSTSNCNLAQLYSQNMHFIMNDNYNSQSTTNCAPANIDIQNFNEIKSNMEIIYKFTCPTPVIDLGQDIGTLALSNHANIVNLNAIIGCKLEFTDTNALKDTSTVTVIDDLEDDMTFEVDEYLVIHKNDFDLLSEECKYPVFKINEIEQSTDSTNSLKILILHVTTPSLFDYISELHVDATNINLESATKTPAPTSPPTFNGEIINDELVIQAHQDASFHENWKWEQTFNEKNVPDRVNPTGFGQLTSDAFFLPKLVLAFGDVDVSIESSLSADYSINFLVEFWWDWAKSKPHLEQFKLTIDGYMDLTIDVDIDIAAQFFFVVPTIFNAESQKILWMGFVGVPIVPLLNVDFMISSPELHITLTPKYKVEYDFELGVAYNSEKGWYNIENINKKEQISSGLQLSTDMTFDGCQVGIPFGLGFRISAGVELYDIIQLTTNLHLWGKSKLNIPGESGGNAICEKDPLEAVINTDFTLSMTIEAFFTGKIPYLKINPNDLWLGRWIYQIPFLHDVPIGEVQISFPLNNQLDQFFRGLCCDIPAPEAAPTVAPYWNFMNEQITYSTNGKCIGIDGWNDLYIYDCNGENNQAWTMRAFDGLISNANNDNLCLEADGEWPKLKTCTGASNQIWQLISTGLSFMIMNEQNCLTKFDNTDRLKVTACGSNDQWILGTQIPDAYIPQRDCNYVQSQPSNECVSWTTGSAFYFCTANNIMKTRLYSAPECNENYIIQNLDITKDCNILSNNCNCLAAEACDSFQLTTSNCESGNIESNMKFITDECIRPDNVYEGEQSVISHLFRCDENGKALIEMFPVPDCSGNPSNVYVYDQLSCENADNTVVSSCGTTTTPTPTTTTTFGTRNYIICPESLGSDVSYKQDNDYGLNIFARTAKGSEYAKDCFLRYSRSFASEVDAEIVVNNFINPNDNIVVFIHGWQPSFDDKFLLPDQWNAQIHDTCTVWPESNQGGLEPCPPTDHDAQFWIKNGFNVIHLDWRQYAHEPLPSGAQFAEKKIYTPIYNGKNVVELLYEKLVAVLDMVNWNGDELRIAGNSLGAQVTMKLAVEFKLHSVYANKLRRIALLDAYFSPEEFDYFSPKSSTGNIALSEYLPILRNADVPVLIENYRTSFLPQILMNENTELNKRTIFVELKAWYYPVEATAGKHVAALAIYEHCMKFTGPLDKNAPSCRMSTQEMQWMSDTIWCPDQKNGGTAPCSYTFVQRASIDDPTAYTTWDTDDKFDRNGWPNYFIYANQGGYVAEATLTYINSNNKDEKYGPYHASVGLPIEFFIPRDVTGIFIFANAVGGVGIFSKYYPTSQEIYWCDQFDVMGTTLSTDYANVAGGTKHCYDISDSFKYRINNKGAYVVGTTLTYTKSNNEYVTEYQDASVGFSNEFFIPPNSKWIKITVNAILGAQIFEKYYQTQQEINWCNNFDVSGIIWGEDYTNVAGGSKTCYDYS